MIFIRISTGNRAITGWHEENRIENAEQAYVPQNNPSPSEQTVRFPARERN
jgi:hypothetical protein